MIIIIIFIIIIIINVNVLNSDRNANVNDDNNDVNDENDEYINPNHPPIPIAPTKEEWIKHHITHMPFKAWCPTCVKNAAMNNPHKLTHHFRGIAMFNMDYMYMTPKPSNDEVMHPILVIK